MHWYRTSGLHSRRTNGRAGSIRLHKLAREVQVGHRLAGCDGPDDFRRHDHQQLGVVLLKIARAEQSSKEGDVAEARNLAQLFRDAVVEQAADSEALPGFELDFGLNAPRGKTGNGGSLKRESIREIERAYLGRYLQSDGSARSNGGREIDANAEFTKLDGHRAQARAAALQRGKRKFAAR